MRARILVIDDEESIRFTFERFLKAAGHLVTTVASCTEALTELEESSFDVVFADIILEDGTGIEVLRAIKSRGLSCPVIMITGDPGVETASEALRLGAFDYIPKPVNQESLLYVTRVALKFKDAHVEKERYRANLEAIFRSVNDAIITVDQQVVVIALNEAAMHLCGATQDDIGQPFRDIANRCKGSCSEILEQALRSSTPIEAKRNRMQAGEKSNADNQSADFASP